MSEKELRTAGPVIVWLDYGSEGWVPESFPTLKAALEAQRYSHDFVITRKAEYDVVDRTPALETPHG